MDNFFSGKHLNEKVFDQNFEQFMNQQLERIHRLEQKQGGDNVWYNEGVQMHELDKVINKLHNTECSSDENNFHTGIIVLFGPKIRTCLVIFFKPYPTNSVWPLTESLVFFSLGNLLNQTIPISLRIDLSA